MEKVDALVAKMRSASHDARDGIREELIALCNGPDGAQVRDHLERAARGQVLEIQWELEEIVEETTPAAPVAAAPPEPEPEPEPEPPADGRLTAKDLDVVYDDPRGLILHRTKDGKRWFATQVDPRTGQPQTFELHPTEIDQLKAQLAGSPYWVLGQAPA